jgi:hypothetical protein
LLAQQQAISSGFKGAFVRRAMIDYRWKKLQYKAERLEFHMAPIRVGGASMGLLSQARGGRMASLFTADQSGHICGWDLLTKQLILSSKVHDYPIVSLEGHLGSNMIVSADTGVAVDCGNSASVVFLSALTGETLSQISRNSELDDEDY